MTPQQHRHDTDQIIPKQFLKRIERTGYERLPLLRLALHLRRQQAAPRPTPTSSSTSPSTRAPRSSSPKRTSAAAPPRARRLGHQPVRLPRRHRPHLRRHLLLQRRQERHHPRRLTEEKSKPSSSAAPPTPRTRSPSTSNQTVTDDQGFHAHFDIDPFRKHCLLNGLDDIGLTLAARRQDLDAYEAKHNTEFWLAPKSPPSFPRHERPQQALTKAGSPIPALEQTRNEHRTGALSPTYRRRRMLPH